MNIETERKFLIELPDLCYISALPDCSVREITQTYLTSPSDSTKLERRLRRIIEDGKVYYILTEKKPLSSISRYEKEVEITEEEYSTLYSEASSELFKTRYSFPHENHIMEIDVYPEEIGTTLLRGHAILEVELESEDEEIRFPEFIKVIREVTNNKSYSNKGLAKKL